MRSLAIDSSLEGIAGAPLAMLTVPNTASSPLDIGPTEARILYAVASTSGAVNGIPITSIGTDSNNNSGMPGSQIILSAGSGSGSLMYRGEVIGGSPIYQNIMPDWPANRPLAVCGWWDGSRFGSQAYRSTTTVSEPSTGSMNAAPRLRMNSILVETGTRPITALTYRGVHDLATRTRILGWLMQRYSNL